ncbi:MAG: hypothetical protein ACJAZ1_000855 [Yoonia sp.]|jgi:hypothetical protein
MKSRWQSSLEAAASRYDTPMPWARGLTREAMISRREERAIEDVNPSALQAQSA